MAIFALVGIGIMMLIWMLLFGWIAPLTTGLALRRDSPRRSKPWLMTAAIWGGISVLLVAGLLTFAFIQESVSGVRSRVRAEARAFDAQAHPGPTVALPVPDGMRGSMTVRAEAPDSPVWTVESESGALRVPEGAMRIHEMSVARTGEDGVEWRLASGWYEPVEWDPRRDALPWMGVFRVGMEVTMSPFSDEVRADLQFADAAGRLYELESPCGRPETAQGLELIDGRGETVWSGRFSFG